MKHIPCRIRNRGRTGWACFQPMRGANVEFALIVDAFAEISEGEAVARTRQKSYRHRCPSPDIHRKKSSHCRFWAGSFVLWLTVRICWIGAWWMSCWWWCREKTKTKRERCYCCDDAWRGCCISNLSCGARDRQTDENGWIECVIWFIGWTRKLLAMVSTMN